MSVARAQPVDWEAPGAIEESSDGAEASESPPLNATFNSLLVGDV
jgi:hypothetical protein